MDIGLLFAADQITLNFMSLYSSVVLFAHLVTSYNLHHTFILTFYFSNNNSSFIKKSGYLYVTI